MPSFHPRAIAKTHGWEYLVRFLFGGAVTVATGLIAKAYGPSIGGLFLAFPAALPASFTLLKRHDGSEEAAECAAGATLGAVGLIPFAVVTIALGADYVPPLVLALATASWAATSLVLWRIVYGRFARKTKSPDSRRPGLRAGPPERSGPDGAERKAVRLASSRR